MCGGGGGGGVIKRGLKAGDQFSRSLVKGKPQLDSGNLWGFDPGRHSEEASNLFSNVAHSGEPRSPEEEARLQEETRQSSVDAATAAVNSEFNKFDDPYYAGLAKKYSDYQLPLLGEQKATALRNLELRAPTRRSSAYAEQLANLERDAGRGEIDINSGALDFANQARQRTEDRRGTLLTQVQAGMGSEAAQAAAASQAAALAVTPEISPIADLFQRYSSIYANNTLAQNGGAQGYPGIFGSRGSSSPSSGSGSSVRSVR